MGGRHDVGAAGPARNDGGAGLLALASRAAPAHLPARAYYLVDCVAPWAAETPALDGLSGALLPGAQHVFAFHAVVAGECWAAALGEPPRRLAAGDFVAFPRGEAHGFASAPGLRAAPDPAVFQRLAAEPLPLRVRYGAGDGPRTQLVCGFLGCDARPFNPLLGALPRLLHASRADGGEWLARFVDLAVEEMRAGRPGGGPVLARLSELLFIEVVRRHVAALPPGQAGWLGGLRDEFVGKALARLHGRPDGGWTLQRLAREVGLSRSALAERFARLVGEPPMHYLLRWRLQRGALRLADGATVQEAADEAGYASEAAFSRAFKKVVGAPPAAWAQARRRAGGLGPAARMGSEAARSPS